MSCLFQGFLSTSGHLSPHMKFSNKTSQCRYAPQMALAAVATLDSQRVVVTVGQTYFVLYSNTFLVGAGNQPRFWGFKFSEVILFLPKCFGLPCWANKNKNLVCEHKEDKKKALN